MITLHCNHIILSGPLSELLDQNPVGSDERAEGVCYPRQANRLQCQPLGINRTTAALVMLQ